MLFGAARMQWSLPPQHCVHMIAQTYHWPVHIATFGTSRKRRVKVTGGLVGTVTNIALLSYRYNHTKQLIAALQGSVQLPVIRQRNVPKYAI